MRYRRSVPVLIGLLLGLATVRDSAAQTPGWDPADWATLVADLAEVNAEIGRGPLDGCAIETAIGLSPAELAVHLPPLADRIDVPEDTCSVPRHHGNSYNRGRIETVRMDQGRTVVEMTTQVSDRVMRVRVEYEGPRPTWTRVAVEETSVAFIFGRLNEPPAGLRATMVAALEAVLARPLRVDDRMALHFPGPDSVWVPDPEVRARMEDPSPVATDPPGRFLERAACLEARPGDDPSPVGFLPRDGIECEPSGDGIAHLLIASTVRPRPPNLWSIRGWVWLDDRVRVYEGTFSWEGLLLSLEAVGETGSLPATGGGGP